MSASRVLRRWNRWAILLLVALNTLLWVPFALSAGHSRLTPSPGVPAGCRALLPR